MESFPSMVETPGMCIQTRQCERARHGRIVTVPLGVAFVCPECGHGLVAPTQQTPAPVRRAAPVLPVGLAVGAVVLLGGAVLIGKELGAGTGSAAVAMQATPPSRLVEPTSAPVIAAVAQPGPASSQAKPAVTPTPAATAGVAPAASADAPTRIAAVAPASAPTLPNPIATPVANPLVTSPATTPPPAAPQAATKAAPSGQFASAPPATLQAGNAASKPMVASISSGLVQALPVVAAPPPPAPPVAIAAPPPAALPPDPPFNPVPVSGGAPTYPATLAADGRPGRVPVTCVIAADGRPQSCRAGATRSGSAFVAATMAWLDHGRVRFHPLTEQGRPVAATRSWVVAIEEAPTVLAEARRKAAAALAQSTPATPVPPEPVAKPDARLAEAPPRPAPQPALRAQTVAARQVLPQAALSGRDRPFSTRVLKGGTPTFPVVYDESRPGQVTVRCTIETNGAPTGCSVLSQEGGSAFGESVQAWLRSGRVRFAPIVSDGQPVSRVQSWTIDFSPPT